MAHALLARGNPVLRRDRAKAIAEGEARGEARGKADAILAIIERRGLTPDSEARNRLRGCQDLATLDRWLEQALNAESLADVFAKPQEF